MTEEIFNSDNAAPPRNRLRRYFFTGVLITAPVGLTLYLAWEFIKWVDELVTPYLPSQLDFGHDIPGVGLVVALVSLTAIGAVMNGFLGAWFTRLSEVFLNRVPVVKTVYTVIKQVLHTALTDQSQAFREAVMIEFPREGVWVLGFVTSRKHQAVDQALGEKMVSVMIPTTPTLTSGYVVFVAENKVRPINMPADQALKLIISGGLIN